MTARAAIEVERTFELAPGAALPDLAGVDGIVDVRLLGVEDLDATYYDTEDLRLAANKATLRRRKGGRDAGWHLKLPVAKGAREEVTLTLGRATTVPAELKALVRSRTRGAALQPVVRLRTRRTVLLLMDADQRVLAELADDEVVAQDLVSGQEQSWREVEVELVAGDVVLLDSVTAALNQAGAWVSPLQSKLGRALGDRLPSRGIPVLGKKSTAAEAVLAHLVEQVDELVRMAPAARRDLPDGVHKMRVATRRLRSALKTYRPLLDRAVTDPVRLQLKAFADVLGAARDAEVLRERLLEAVPSLPPDVDQDTVAARIRHDLGEQHAHAHAAVVKELDSVRLVRLLEALHLIVTAPPWTAKADRRASTEVPRLVGRTVLQLDRKVAHAALLHEVRKAAKQARYAAESAAAVVGTDAVRFAKRVTRVQEVLGEHQDSLVAQDRLRSLALHADALGESSFALGLLHAREEQRGALSRDAYQHALKRVSGARARAWLG